MYHPAQMSYDSLRDSAIDRGNIGQLQNTVCDFIFYAKSLLLRDKLLEVEPILDKCSLLLGKIDMKSL
jgi:hypothetical protein